MSYPFVEAPIGVTLVMIIILFSLIFLMARCDNQDYHEHWENKTVLINATEQEGVVIGGSRSRDQGRMLSIRLKNGNVLSISAKQVTIIEPKKTQKEIEIEKIEAEITSKQIQLKELRSHQ